MTALLTIVLLIPLSAVSFHGLDEYGRRPSTLNLTAPGSRDWQVISRVSSSSSELIRQVRADNLLAAHCSAVSVVPVWGSGELVRRFCRLFAVGSVRAHGGRGPPPSLFF